MMVRRLVASLLTAVASDGSTGGQRSESDSPRRSEGGLSARRRERLSAASRSDRGQSELVGTVLILGLSMTVIGTSVALGGVALGDLITSAEADNVENGMSHLSSKANLVALGDADSQRFSLGLMREGTVSVRPDAGSITITHVTGAERNESFNGSLGALVYESDNREVAYQGGGIWTKRNGNGSLSSPPEYYYRGTTLTFPIIQINGSGVVGGRPSGQITPVGVATDAVPNVSSPLDNGSIEVKVQSEYYEGWYDYFVQRTDGETTIYHANQTVISTLTVPDEVTFSTAISAQTGVDPGDISGSAEVNPPGSLQENVAHRSADPLVDEQVESASGDNDNAASSCLSESGISGSCTLTAGTYFIDQDETLAGNLDIDTSSGNVTLVVNGTFDVSDKTINVTDTTTNNGVTYYINGSLQAQGNAEVGTASTEPESERNVFYVADGFLDGSTGTGNIDFEAVIYAPDADIKSAGKGSITGSIVVNSIEKLNGRMDITYDSDLQDETIEVTGAADLLTYLHVSHNEIEIVLD